ncbi:MAG: hypothetical protein M3R16_04865 [Pseudomonadota bacterium]|nr:hypothetical protein [Pseudomonadota bacterium]
MPIAQGKFLLVSLLVALLAGLLFTPGLPGSFVFDDIPNIVNNKTLQLTELDIDGLVNVAFSPQPAGNMRTLPNLTFAVDHWRAGGMDPAVFKTTNLVIHALTAFTLAWFFRSLLLVAGVSAGRVRWAAPALALAWAAHPLQVSSVLYVVQRMQTMGTLFLVLALWAYLLARQAQIEGRPGRTGLLAAALLWFFAMGCKEDSILLPAYTLALELTVLRFDAASPRLASRLRRGYLFAAVAAAAAYLFIVIPQYWQWNDYPGRDFSTWERLLTQARVLCLYLWQIVMPLPQHMPFYYDGLQPSRGLLQPWTTLPAIALLAALLGVAWRLRTRWPLFALGVFLFFSAHFIASNVVGLELAFEHRNHFALVGAVLAVGSLLAHASERARVQLGAQATLCAFLLVGLGSATMLRASTWSSSLGLEIASTQLAPNSARAWYFLCAGYVESGGGALRVNPNLDKAIAACTSGAKSAPYALNNLALLVVLKTIRGDVTPRDWDRLQQRFETVHMTVDNRSAFLLLISNARNGVKLDKQELIKVLATQVQRADLAPFHIAVIGYFIMNDLAEPDQAIPFFVEVIKASPPDDTFPQQLSGELRAMGRPDLAGKIERLGTDRRSTVAAPPRASGTSP